MMDKLKGAAGTAKGKVDVMVDKAGEKMPPKVKQTYGKVSDKVEKAIPGKKGAAEPESDTEAADIVAPGAGLEAEQANDVAGEPAAEAEDAASAAAMTAEGTADT